MSGDFTDELGEDFFGFRELGLDKEFDLISLSVSSLLPICLLKRSLCVFSRVVCGQLLIPQAVRVAMEPLRTSCRNHRYGNQLHSCQ